jgi:hypothetical protein
MFTSKIFLNRKGPPLELLGGYPDLPITHFGCQGIGMLIAFLQEQSQVGQESGYISCARHGLLLRIGGHESYDLSFFLKSSELLTRTPWYTLKPLRVHFRSFFLVRFRTSSIQNEGNQIAYHSRTLLI